MQASVREWDRALGRSMSGSPRAFGGLSRARVLGYLRGLLSPVARKNG